MTAKIKFTDTKMQRVLKQDEPAKSRERTKTKKFNFTDTKLKQILKQNKPDKGRVSFMDKQQGGLRLILSSSGKMTFQFSSWDSLRKRPAYQTLGTYPTLSIKAARDRCEKLAANVSSGIDIAGRKKEAKEEPVLNEAFDDYLKDHAKVHKRDWRGDENRYNNYIREEIGNKRVSDITGEVVQRLQNKLLKRKKERGKGTLSPSTVNRVMALISSIYGVTQKNLPNPTKEVKKEKEHGKGNPLQPHEFPQFWMALNAETERPDVADAIRLLVLTGQRRSNVFGMKWTDINLDRTIPVLAKDKQKNDIVITESAPVWVIGHEDFKGKRNMEVPLTPVVVEILERIKKNRSKSLFVFPAPGDLSRPLNDVRRPWNRIKKAAGIAIRLHDLRHSFGTFMAASGAATPQLQLAMGHKDPSTSSIYVNMQSDAVRRSVEIAQQAMLGSNGTPKVANINGAKK